MSYPHIGSGEQRRQYAMRWIVPALLLLLLIAACPIAQLGVRHRVLIPPNVEVGVGPLGITASCRPEGEGSPDCASRDAHTYVVELRVARQPDPDRIGPQYYTLLSWPVP